MCIGENNAEHTSKYINSQLATLYSIAVECADHYTLEQKRDSSTSGYDYALAEFHTLVPARAGLPELQLEARLGVPTVHFICDHRARFSLDVQYFSAEPIRAQDAVHIPKFTRPFTVDFVVPFQIATFSGSLGAIGNGRHNITSYVFDFKAAEFVQDAEPNFIKHYYVPFLARAGHHVIQGVPDFSDSTVERISDFTAVTEEVTATHAPKLFGIDVDTIETYLSNAWRKAGLNLNPDIPRTPGEVVNTIFAHYRTKTSVKGVHFEIEFAAPNLRVICPEDVVFRLNIPRITFWNEGRPEQTTVFRNWSFGLFVPVFQLEDDTGEKYLHISLDTGVRFAPGYSTFDNFEPTDDTHWAYRDVLFTFFETNYLPELGHGDFNVIYKKSLVPRLVDHEYTPDEDQAWTVHVKGSSSHNKPRTLPRSATSELELYGFPQIVALGQASFELHFIRLFKQAPDLAQISNRNFNISFDRVRVRLLTGETTLIFLSGKDLVLTPVDGGQLEDIGDVSLAYIVPIKRRTFDLENDEYSSTLSKVTGSIRGLTGGVRRVEQLYLDFSNAALQPELSNLVGLFKPTVVNSHHLFRRLTRFVRDTFFYELVAEQSHVLFSFPTFPTPTGEDSNLPGDAPNAYTFTDFIYSTYSKTRVTPSNFKTLPIEDSPVLIIAGVSGGKPLPRTRIEYSSPWSSIINNNYGYGIVALDGDFYTQKRILANLAEINAVTTIAAHSFTFGGVNGWNIELVTWKQRPSEGSQEVPAWKLVRRKGDTTTYEWRDGHHWDYFQKGVLKEQGGLTSELEVDTVNTLVIPNNTRNGIFEIAVSGKTKAAAALRQGARDIRSSAEVTWAISIQFISSEKGLNVSVNVLTSPEAVSNEPENYEFEKITRLRPDFARTELDRIFGAIDFSGFVDSFRVDLAGNWQSLFGGETTLGVSSAQITPGGHLISAILPPDWDDLIKTLAPQRSARKSTFAVDRGREAERRSGRYNGAGTRAIDNATPIPVEARIVEGSVSGQTDQEDQPEIERAPRRARRSAAKGSFALSDLDGGAKNAPLTPDQSLRLSLSTASSFAS